MNLDSLIPDDLPESTKRLLRDHPEEFFTVAELHPGWAWLILAALAIYAPLGLLYGMGVLG